MLMVMCLKNLFKNHWPLDEEEGPNYPIIVTEAYVAVTILYIPADQFLRRPVSRSPLLRVAMGGHERTRIAIDFHDPLKIRKNGFVTGFGKAVRDGFEAVMGAT